MSNLVITIARSYGSGGRQLGRALAKALGISFYDRNLIQEASEHSGISLNLFGLNDEKVKSKLFRKKPELTDVPRLPDDEKFISDDNIFNIQAKVIRDIAARESCVIVGRCGNYILRKHDNLVRVFVYAPQDTCIMRVKGRYGCDAKEAEKIIDETNKERSAYHKHYTELEWNDPANYDICIDSSKLTEELVVKLILDYIDMKKSEVNEIGSTEI